MELGQAGQEGLALKRFPFGGVGRRQEQHGFGPGIGVGIPFQGGKGKRFGVVETPRVVRHGGVPEKVDGGGRRSGAGVSTGPEGG